MMLVHASVLRGTACAWRSLRQHDTVLVVSLSTCRAAITAPARSPIQVSWAKGSKKATLCGDDIRLPQLQAPDAVGQPAPFWVRFIGDPRAWPGEASVVRELPRQQAGTPTATAAAADSATRGRQTIQPRRSPASQCAASVSWLLLLLRP